MKRPYAPGAIKRARALRQNITQAEQRISEALRLHRTDGYKFRRQVPIAQYIADFVCHEARLIVEIDGGHHDLSAPREAERIGFLEREGYRVVRFWNNEVLANRDGVRQTIADALGRITPTPPSPIEGEGSHKRLVR